MGTDILRRFNFTQAKVKGIQSQGRRVDYKDLSQPKLRLRVSSTGAKSFLVYMWHPKLRKPVSITIGKFPDINVTEARKKAQQIIIDVSNGVVHSDENKRAKAKLVTLRELYQYYIKSKGQKLKPSTIKDYGAKLEQQFNDWLDIPAERITEQMVSDRYNNNGLKSSAGIRTLRAIFNYAVKHELISKSPITNKLEVRQEKRKDRFIRSDKLGIWIDAVNYIGLKNKKAQAYLLLLLFTGCRSSEALGVLINDVDFSNNSIVVRNTKNRSDFTIYLPDSLIPYIKQIYDSENIYLFQGSGGSGHMSVPRKPMNEVTRLTGIQFSSHDLRRTFATIAQDAGVSIGLIKELLNHSRQGDVTLGYIQTEAKTLRRAINQVSDLIVLNIKK